MAQYVMSMLRVSKIVPPKRQIIKDISLSFFPGAKIGLLGLNGAGKSTVLKIMAGVEKEYDGEVQWQPNISIGYLPQEPQLDADKTVREVSAVHAESGATGQAYEIHLGASSGPDTNRAPFEVAGLPEGAQSRDGRVSGTYLHGVLASDPLRAAWLGGIAGRGLVAGPGYEASVEAALDALARHLECHLDIAALLALARSRSGVIS